MATLVFNSIDLRDGASAIPGVLKVDTDGLSWDAASSDKKAAVQKDEVEEMCWLTMATGLQLKCTKKDGDVVRFTGSWDQEAVTNLKYHSKEHFNIDMAKAKMATKGWNWGMPVIGPTSMTFDVEGTEAFEVPLGQVTQVTENKHEVALEFTPDDGEDGEQLVEMRFFVPPTQAVEEPTEGQQLTPAQELLNKIRERADISNLERGGIAEIKQANFVVPRGKYDMEMFNSFLTLRGQSYNYKIAYTQITRLFLLPRPGQTALNFVISVDPPIRQGKTAYSHLIIQLPENDEITIGLNLSESEKKEHGAKLEEEMTGKTYVLLANILKQLSQKKMAIPKTFRSSKGDSCLRCAHKANDGMLFLLDSSFFFILKPAMHIRFAEIQSVEIDRMAKAEKWQARANKSWDIMIHMNHGDIHQFMNIDQNEFEPFVHFLKGKDLKLIGDLATENSRSTYSELDQDEEDDEDEDESEDDDFDGDAMQEEDVEEEFNEDYDSDADSDDDGEGSGGEPKKKKKRPAAGSSGTPKVKKLKHGPKKAQSSFFMFMQENRAKIVSENPGLAFSEVGKKIGEVWRSLGEAEKGKYEEMAKADKVRYADELALWQKEHPEEVEAMSAQAAGGKSGKRKAKAGGPKRGLSSYMFFSKAMRAQVVEENPDIAFSEVAKKIGEKWKALADADKVPYEKEAAEDKARYAKEKAAYDSANPSASPAEKKKRAAPAKKAKKKTAAPVEEEDDDDSDDLSVGGSGSDDDSSGDD